MKRTIRLTESDLHSLIAESVRQCLTELDWKTYDSAARKSYEKADESGVQNRQKHVNRYFDFLRASEDAFNDEFSEVDDTGNGYTYRSRGDWGRPTSYVGTTQHSPIRKVFRPQGEYPNPNIPYNWSSDDTSHKFGDAKKRGDKELSDYFNGKYKYVNGRGWTTDG